MKRLPERQEIIRSFLTTLTVVNFWGLIVFFYNYPGLIKHLAFTEVLSILGYVLFSALIESLVVTGFILILSMLLPGSLLRSDFSVRTALLVFLTTIYIVPFHLILPRISALMFDVSVIAFLLLWTLLYVVELVLFHKIIPRYPIFTARVRGFIDRVVVLGAIYLVFNVVSLGFVIAANWKWS